MPDGPFKSMAKDPSSDRVGRALKFGELPYVHVWSCPDCKGWIYAGDWPWCKGDPEGHKR